MMTRSQNRWRLLGLLSLALVLFLGALWGSRPLVHDDLFLHLATGQYVVESHEVPTTDIFSFTRRGERWVSHEWGFGVATFLVWLAAGYSALVSLKAMLVVAILVMLLWLMTQRAAISFRDAGPYLVALLAVGLWAVNDQLILRASLFSSLFILVLMGLLMWFDRHRSAFAFAAIVLLFLGWGNFHGEVLFGLFLLSLTVIEALLGRLQAKSSLLPSTLLQVDPRRPYLWLLAVSFLATLLNPNGIQVLLYPFRLAIFLFGRGDALKMGHFGGATPAAAAGFYLLIAILLLAMLPLERLKALSFTDVVTVSAFLVLSLRSHRFIFFFTLFALPTITKLMSQRLSAAPLSRLPSMLRHAIAAVTLFAVAVTAAAAWRDHDRMAVSRHFPDGAVRFLRQEGIGGRMFNHQNYGGYLRWSLAEPVYWDGRNLLFASLMEETTDRSLEEVADHWQIDYLVLTEFEYRQLYEQLDPTLWGLVYWDDRAAIYLRQSFAQQEISQDRPLLRQLPPFGGVTGLETLSRDPVWLSNSRQELDRILQFEPECQRALYFHGLISFYSGDEERAEEELRQALEVGPNPHIFTALARVLDSMGRQEEAQQMRLEAIEAELK